MRNCTAAIALALVRKDPDYYPPRLGNVRPDLPYLWSGGPPAAVPAEEPPT